MGAFRASILPSKTCRTRDDRFPFEGPVHALVLSGYSMREQRPNVDVDAVLVDFPVAHPPNRRGRYSQRRSVLARVGHFDPRDDYVVECPDFKQFVLDGSKQIQELLRTRG